ncbi:helix-turn-helix domain-containing protein [Parabacteroides sp.]
MEKTAWDGIIFIDSVKEYDTAQYSEHVLHILCTEGSMSFIFQNVRYNILSGDYVILTNVSLASAFSESPDFRAVMMSLSAPFITSMAIRSNYGIIGHLSLLQNPVMKLSARDFQRCREDMERIRERLDDEGHLFREEMLGYLLMAHILDLYDIHVRGTALQPVPERTRYLLQQFIELLYHGEYIRNRDLSYYASRLYITPHYLSEICKKVSGKPATYWIDNFTLLEITRLLRQKELSLMEIADRLNFSSLSYFSRYVQKRIGVSPSEYRNRTTT